MELSDIRAKIDTVDDQLLQLFLERMALAEEVAAYKNEHKLPIVNKQREREVLAKVTERSGDKERYAYHLFSTLFELARSRQAELISAPTVQSQITGGRGIITGSNNETTEESYNWANGLAIQIQSGALPMDIAEVETRAISATLGVEAIKGALIAGVIGLILILIFMLVMYRLPGVAADMALLIYVLIVFYALAISGAQLTLQGIAGILLGIGMAVDANVVIFERFREELKEGRTPLNAVKYGFRNAGRAVLDSNVTTLIAAVVLMIFGTGTIKGFALTLTISVVVSLFTAVVVTRSLLILICKLGVNNRSAYTR